MVYIYLHEWLLVGKYTSPMHPMRNPTLPPHPSVKHPGIAQRSIGTWAPRNPWVR